MSYSTRKLIFGREILFNNTGQIQFKKRFFYKLTTKFYRFVLGS